MELEEIILKHGQNREIYALRKVLENTKTEEILRLISTKVNSPSFTFIWNYILLGFTESKVSQKKRSHVVLELLREIDRSDLPSNVSNSILQRICLDLPKYHTDYLMELCDLSLNNIQNYKHNNLSWKELLPEVIGVMSEREKICYNGSEVSGSEFKTQFINALCLVQWSPSIATAITAMFIDMQLTKEEHLQVLNKLGQFFEKLTPQEVPTFVFQLLKFCKNYNGRSIFPRIQHYFGVRVYEHLNIQSENSSESTNMDLIEDAIHHDAIEAESTVLFHIYSSASLCSDCIRDYLSSLKNVLRAPEFILHPFQLTNLLMISTLPHYEDNCFDLLRTCVSRAFSEQLKRKHSCWFREMISTTCKVESIFELVISLSLQDRELVLQGLVNFSFVLMNVGAGLFLDQVTEKQWKLGSMILIKIMKRKRHLVPTIAQTLINTILTGQHVSQHIECMYILSRSLALLILENQNCIVELIEGLVQLPGPTAIQLLDAVTPLSKVSSPIRDRLIIVLRKALYSSVMETRQMAVVGFLKLLTDLKISSMLVLSQGSQSSGSFSSGHSLLTQISLNRTTQSAKGAFSNEYLCLEILSILVRCFSQQVEVRNQLYEGLFPTVCQNPELSIPILEIAWSHLCTYYIMNEDTLPPLNFNKVAATKDVQVSPQEPLGKFIHVIGLIIIKAQEAEMEEDGHFTVSKFVDVYDSLCYRMMKCELVNFELDDGTDLLDNDPESQQKCLILKEAMCVYEALIGYKIMSWKSKSDKFSQQIISLFQAYSRLLHFSKNLSKSKKKKKKNESDTVSQGTSRKQAQHKHQNSFKLPESVLGIETITKALSLFYEPAVKWATIQEANLLKSKREIHRHMLHAAISLVNQLKHTKHVKVESNKLCYSSLSDVAIILYKGCVKQLNQLIDFDCASAVMSIECFYSILALVCNQYKSNLLPFLQKICNKEKHEELVPCLTDILEVFQKLFVMSNEEDNDDLEMKKISVLVINTIVLISNQIPSESSALSIQLTEWLRNFAHNDVLHSKQLVMPFVSLLFDMHLRFKMSLKLFDEVTEGVGQLLGIIDEEKQSQEQFKIINETSVDNVYICLYNRIKNILEEVDWLICRLRSEYNIITYPGEQNIDKRRDNLKSKERGVTCQLCFIVTILTSLSNIAAQPGNLTEALFKNIAHIFNTLSNLTKYFTLRSSKINPTFQGARFERLVKLAGKGLSPTVYRLIIYVEESQKEQNESTQKKKSTDISAMKNKILKDTKSIPKTVYEMEQFSKSVIQLSNKTKIDLSKYVGQGTVRDFRILQLKEVLLNTGGEVPETQELNESDIVEEEEEDELTSSSHHDTNQPPTKKARK